MHMKRYYKLIFLLVFSFSLFVNQAVGQIPQDVINAAIHATVQINIFHKDAKGEYQYIGNGSGSILNPSGLILTNYHVALDYESRKAWDLLVIGYTKFTDQAPQPVCYAEFVYGDPNLDLALLECYDKDGNPLPENFFPYYFELGNSDRLQLGQNIYIIGYPGIGEGLITFTSGRVSAFTQQRAWISTDATVAGGNSGGAALDDSGYLIGVPTEIGGMFARVGSDGKIVTANLNHIRPINFATGMIYTYIHEVERQSKQEQAQQPTQPQQPQQPGQKESEQAVYMGRLVSAETGRGISGATIGVFKPGVKIDQVTETNLQDLLFTTAQTDTNGNFQLEHALTVGRSYSVVIYANGYEFIAMDDGITVKESGRWDLGDIKMVRQKR